MLHYNFIQHLRPPALCGGAGVWAAQWPHISFTAGPYTQLGMDRNPLTLEATLREGFLSPKPEQEDLAQITHL
jgi:hypothetical protein